MQRIGLFKVVVSDAGELKFDMQGNIRPHEIIFAMEAYKAKILGGLNKGGGPQGFTIRRADERK